jgi:hypothetical protein
MAGRGPKAVISARNILILLPNASISGSSGPI